MWIAIAGPKCSIWFEPIVGTSFWKVLSEAIEPWINPDKITIEGNQVILSWNDNDITDEELWIGVCS